MVEVNTCEQDPPTRLRGWQRVVFPSLFLITLGQTVAGVSTHSDGVAAFAGYLVVVAFCVAYLFCLLRIGHHDRRPFWIGYGVLCALFVIELGLAHQDAVAMLTFVGTLAIAVLWWRAVPIVIALVLLAVYLPAMVASWHSGIDADAGWTLAIVLAAMFAFFNLMRANVELTDARAEIAVLAAEGERQRIARDLHDLLGHSLTTITVKAGLARRLFENGEAERAAVEITEVENLSRQSLVDVRAAVSGYRETTLTGELATARELLRTLEVAVHFPTSIDVVDPRYHELFGWVVREGVTNSVRHAHASTCSITLGRDWIEISDDGVGGALVSGNGLRGLRERVEAAGGTLTGGGSARGWTVRATMVVGVDQPPPSTPQSEMTFDVARHA